MPLIRVMALHALGYCERLFYLEEVEEIRLADARVHAGHADHAELDLAEGDELKGFELTSEALGLVGKLDAIRHRDGTWTPYEYKRGRACRTSDDNWQAWDADILQVLAYALLLEDSICLGPGSIDQAHTRDEFISIEDLEAGAAHFTKLVREISI